MTFENYYFALDTAIIDEQRTNILNQAKADEDITKQQIHLIRDKVNQLNSNELLNYQHIQRNL